MTKKEWRKKCNTLAEEYSQTMPVSKKELKDLLVQVYEEASWDCTEEIESRLFDITNGINF